LYDHLPQQRQLPKAVKEKAAGLLLVDANKLVQQQLVQDTGKIVLLKDLSNLAASAKNRMI